MKQRPPQRQNGGRKPGENPAVIQRMTRVTAQQDADFASECVRLAALTGEEWTMSRYLREAGDFAIGKLKGKAS